MMSASLLLTSICVRSISVAKKHKSYSQNPETILTFSAHAEEGPLWKVHEAH